MKLIPAVMASIDPELYEQTKDHLLDMNYADYFYITSYPTYEGYRIEHDPTITAYCQLTTNETTPKEPSQTGDLGPIILIAIGIALLAGFLVAIRKRK
jgi:LPXTG-motif cell wall-anchored protein